MTEKEKETKKEKKVEKTEKVEKAQKDKGESVPAEKSDSKLAKEKSEKKDQKKKEIEPEKGDKLSKEKSDGVPEKAESKVAKEKSELKKDAKKKDGENEKSEKIEKSGKDKNEGNGSAEKPAKETKKEEKLPKEKSDGNTNSASVGQSASSEKSSKEKAEKLEKVALEEDDPEKRLEKEERRKLKEEWKKQKEEMLAKEKELKKKVKEEKMVEKMKEKEEKKKEKEVKKGVQSKRQQMKERRKSWLKSSMNVGAVDMEQEKGSEDEKSATTEVKNVPFDLVRRQREWEQFLLNMPLKKLRGTTWKYYDIAPEDGFDESVVLLHGGGIRPEAMFEYILGLAQHFRVIAPWIPLELNELEDVVAGLILVMRHENVKKAHFIGMSFGGIVAHHFLYRHPTRVFTCTLIHAQAPDEKFSKIYGKWLKNMDSKPPPALLRMLTGHLAKGKELEAHVVDLSPGERDLWASILKKCAAHRNALIAYVETMMDYHEKITYTAKDFKRWEGRLLLIESQDDEIYDAENFNKLIALHNGASIHYFQGSGSLLSLARGEMVVDVILKFIWDDESHSDTSELVTVSEAKPAKKRNYDDDEKSHEHQESSSNGNTLSVSAPSSNNSANISINISPSPSVSRKKEDAQIKSTEEP